MHKHVVLLLLCVLGAGSAEILDGAAEIDVADVSSFVHGFLDGIVVCFSRAFFFSLFLFFFFILLFSLPSYLPLHL
jgi:hypothetical protein